MAKTSHMSYNNQSNCFISAKYSCATLKVVYDIDSWHDSVVLKDYVYRSACKERINGRQRGSVKESTY